MDARKQDTRNKIQLDGLVIKAGLAEEETAVILGALIMAFDAISGADGEAARRRFRRVGDRVFSAMGVGERSQASRVLRREPSSIDDLG
jgi:hypothetical protein